MRFWSGKSIPQHAGSRGSAPMSLASNSGRRILSTPGSSEDPRGSRRVRWPTLVGGALLFGVILRVLWREWVLSGRYEYGVLALPAVGLLLFRAWRERPEVGEVSERWASVLSWAGVFAAAGIGFGYFVYLANPNWRAVFWLIALSSALLGILAAACAGGARWAWHFAPAWLPLFAAVPWPTRFESAVADASMRWVAQTAATLLQIFGQAAVAIGNTIHLTQGVLGVAEACSGIQSFPLAVFAALVLGEFFKLRPPRKILFVGMGLVFAIGMNFVRVLSLAAVFIEHGESAMVFLHDDIGRVAMILLLLAIWFAGTVLWRGGARCAPRDCVVGDRGAVRPPLRAMAAWGILLIGCIVASHAFYSVKERDVRVSSVASLEPGRIPAGYARQPIPLHVSGELRYSEGYMWQRIHPDGGSAMAVFYLSWQAGEISSFSAVHRPDVCLPSVGVQQVGETEPFDYVCKCNAGSYVFDGYQFSQSGMPLVVFRQVFDSRSGELPLPALTASGRIAAAFRGERIKRRSMIQFVAVNEPDMQRAWQQAVDVLDAAFLVRGDTGP